MIELNPRFGGGYPLSYEAGADFPGALIGELQGTSSDVLHHWRDGLVMLRYDDAVFVDTRDGGV